MADLTKREEFAIRIMAALIISHPSGMDLYGEEVSQDAVGYADALIEALDESETEDELRTHTPGPGNQCAHCGIGPCHAYTGSAVIQLHPNAMCRGGAPI